MDYKSLTTDEKLKLTTYLAVSKTCEDVGLNNTLFGSFTVSREAKELMTEFVWKKLQSYASDMELFSQHAKRTSINPEDIKLIFRNNEKILELIADSEKEEGAEKSGKRKRPSEDGGE